MIHLTRLLLDWPKFLPFLRPPPLVARVIQILNDAAVADKPPELPTVAEGDDAAPATTSLYRCHGTPL